MAKFNVNSNAYIIIYSVVMVVIVAVLLSVTSLSLQERQGENILNEKKQQIVKALGEDPMTASYADVVAEAVMLDKNGNKIEGKGVLQIFDVMGRYISHSEVSGSANISTEAFTSGVYIIRMTDDNGIKTQKVVL